MKIFMKLEYVSKETIRVHVHNNYLCEIAHLLQKINLKWVPQRSYYTFSQQNLKQLHKIVQQYNLSHKTNKTNFKQIFIQDCPQKVLNIISIAIHRAKKQDGKLIVVDPLITQRYGFVLNKLNKMQIGKSSNKFKAIIICPQLFKKQWINSLSKYDIQDFKTHLVFRPLQILTFEKILTLTGSLKKFFPDYVVCDFAQTLVNCDNFTFSLISEFLKSIQNLHFFVCHWMTGSIKGLFTLLHTLKPEYFNQQCWFHKRFANGNLEELKYILENTILFRLGNHNQLPKCYNSMTILSAPQTYQTQAVGISDGPKLTLLTLNAKLISLQAYISFMEKWVGRIVLITSLDLIQRKIIAFLIDNQSLYCTYESIDQFNRKVKQKILVLNISKLISKLQKVYNCTIDNLSEDILPKIYGARYFLFCDCPWNYNLHQQKLLEMLFSKCSRSYVKKYITLSSSYEVEHCQNFIQESSSLRQNQCVVSVPQQKNNPLMQKIARRNQITYEKFTDFANVEGIYDIDEQFDKVEFEILKTIEQQKNQNDKPLYKLQQEQFALQNETSTNQMKEIFIDDSLTMYEPQTVSTEQTLAENCKQKMNKKEKQINNFLQDEEIFMVESHKGRIQGKLTVNLFQNQSFYSLI